MVLRRECGRAGSAPRWAQARGVSERYVYDVLAGKQPPGPKILAAMGYRKVVRYERADA